MELPIADEGSLEDFPNAWAVAPFSLFAKTVRTNLLMFHGSRGNEALFEPGYNDSGGLPGFLAPCVEAAATTNGAMWMIRAKKSVFFRAQPRVLYPRCTLGRACTCGGQKPARFWADPAGRLALFPDRGDGSGSPRP
jgi:hypothetical protein